MNKYLTLCLATALFGAAETASASGPAPQAVPIVECQMTGPGVAICAGAAVVLHELQKIVNGEEAFGPNGEVMKVIAVPADLIKGNIEASERESGVLDKCFRGGLGISVKDIKKHGIFGGPNSVFRKPFG